MLRVDKNDEVWEGVRLFIVPYQMEPGLITDPKEYLMEALKGLPD